MEKSGKPQNSAAKNVSVGRIVMNAVRKNVDSNGISLPGLKKILRDAKKMDVGVHDAEIKLALKAGVDRGVLMKDDGKYKLKEAKGRRSRSRSEACKKSGKRRSRSRSKGRKRSGGKSASSKKRSKRRPKNVEGDEH